MEDFSLQRDAVPMSIAGAILVGLAAFVLWGTVWNGFTETDEREVERVDRLVRLQYGNTQR